MAPKRGGAGLSLFRGSTRAELAQEIETHIRMRVDELVARGMTPDEARAEALRRFGDVEEAQRELYATARQARRRRRRRERWAALARDFGYAARQARRSPGFSLAAVLILALGTGLTSATYTLVDHVLVRALPFPGSHDLVSLQSVNEAGGSFDLTSMANWVDWRQGQSTLSATGLYRAIPGPATVDTGEEVINVSAREVVGQFFQALDPQTLVGRTFSEAEAQDRAPVAVVSEGFWRRVLGSDPDLGSRTLVVDGRPLTVIGVLRQGQELPGNTDLWLPFPSRPGSGAMRNNINWSAVARLAPGVTREQAQTDLTAIARGVMERDPEAVYSHGVRVLPLMDVVIADARPRLQLVMGAAVFVLLVACANLAGLSLARARRREQEVAVRLTLGAGRLRILRQILAEHVLLAAAGGALGLLGAWTGTGMVVRALDVVLPRAQEISFDLRIAAVGILTALLAGVLAGALPAWRASGGTPSSFLTRAHGGIRGGKGLPGATLVAAEVAMAVLLVTGGGLLVRSFQSVVGRDLGYEPEGVAVSQIRLISPEYAEPGRALVFWETLVSSLEGTPDVSGVGVANWIPTGTSGRGWIDLADQPDRDAGAGYRIVSDGYFDALGIPVLEGRSFADQDAPGSDRAVVINRTMAETFWGDESPVGRRLRARSMEQWWWEQGLDPWLTVVGVVGDIRHGGFESDPAPEMYVAHRQIPQRLQVMNLVVEPASGDAASLASLVRERVRGLDPTLAVDVEPLVGRVGGLLAVRRLFMTVLGSFALLALALACIGVYGLLAFTVSERRREFAVRAALGAERGGIVLLTLGRAAPILGVGTGVGLTGALWLSGFLEAQLVEVGRADPITFLGSASLLAVVATCAALVPALRASRLDPVEVLRDS